MITKPTVYLETTIPSYLTERPSSNLIVAGEQEITRRWWSNRRVGFRLFVSELVSDEAGRGDPEASERRMEIITDIECLEVDQAVLDLTRRLLQGGDFPERSATDAGHIAVAARHGLDYLLTWNCKHIANAEMIRRVSFLISEAGYYVRLFARHASLWEAKRMNEDPIVREVRQARREILESYGMDIESCLRDCMRRQWQSGHTVAAPRQKEPESGAAPNASPLRE